MKLKLYLLSQTANSEYDTYDSAVVVAESRAQAALIHPSGRDGTGAFDKSSWVPSKILKVVEIGAAAPHLKAGEVVCASFNAG